MTLSAKAKKYLHAGLLAAASGGLFFVATVLPSIVRIPPGVRGVGVGIIVFALSRLAGYILSEIVVTGPAAPGTPPAAP